MLEKVYEILLNKRRKQKGVVYGKDVIKALWNIDDLIKQADILYNQAKNDRKSI